MRRATFTSAMKKDGGSGQAEGTGVYKKATDGIAPHLKTNPLRPGHRSTDIWKTSSTPVIIKASEEDPTMQGPRTIHPPKGGTVLRIAELQPESEEIRNLSPEKAREVFAAAGNANAAQFGNLL